MSGNNINSRRDPLLFFPYNCEVVSPLKLLSSKFLAYFSLYAANRWTYLETFGNRKDEDKVAQFFQTILATAFDWAGCDSTKMRTNWLDHSGRLVEGLRKPDVILVRRGTQSDITFKDILSYCEVKGPSTTDSQNDALKQLTDITGFASASQLDRRFYISSSLCDRKFQLVAFIRGSTVFSEAIDIDSNPIPFITAVLGLSAASAAWCGFDHFLAPVAGGVYQLNRKFCGKFEVKVGPTLLYAATDMHGKGTRVPFCEVWESYGVPPKMYPIKMSWMPTTYKNAKLSNDIDIAKLMAQRAPSYPVLQGQEMDVFGPDDKYGIFSGCLVSRVDGSWTWDYKKHWPGITIVLAEECEKPTAPCPCPDATLWETGYYPDDYNPPMCQDTTRNILQRFNVPVRINGKQVNTKWEPQDEDASFQPPSLNGETRELLWILYRTCGTSIVWFSCRRELLDGFLGGVAGHSNAFMLKILHCDVSDANLMFKVDDILPEHVIPDWPPEKGAHPKRAGMLGDWGYAADLAEKSSVRRITGTCPYMSTDFLSSVAGASPHAVLHDLESFFWVLWVFCVNMNGPFYTRRRWQDEGSASKKHPADPSYSGSVMTTSSVITGSSTSGLSSFSHISTASVESGGRTEIEGSLIVSEIEARVQRQDTFREQPWHESQSTADVTTRLPYGEDNPEKHAPPIWATPGRHHLSRLDIYDSKKNIPEEKFVECISPYFRQSGSGFIDGLKTLHTYFVKMRNPRSKS